MSKQYVQHVSGQGEKWEVIQKYPNDIAYSVRAKDGTFEHYLPKSEYRLCEPPERWVDVTEKCEILCWGIGHKSIDGNSYTDIVSRLGKNYRLRKVFNQMGYTFVVEKKVCE